MQDYNSLLTKAKILLHSDATVIVSALRAEILTMMDNVRPQTVTALRNSEPLRAAFNAGIEDGLNMAKNAIAKVLEETLGKFPVS